MTQFNLWTDQTEKKNKLAIKIYTKMLTNRRTQNRIKL